MSESVQAQVLRARDLARRARRMASELMLDADRDRLLRHAAELEAQAAELERAEEQTKAVPSAVVQVHQQLQQQQQQSETSSPDPPEKKPTG